MKSQATILLVEDDASIRRYLQAVLERSGYKIVTAEDGLAAMKLVLTVKLDAIITDAVMPHLDGHGLFRFIRQQPKLSEIPVVMLSALDDRESPDTGECRPNAFLKKPVTAAELNACLSGLLHKPETQISGK